VGFCQALQAFATTGTFTVNARDLPCSHQQPQLPMYGCTIINLHSPMKRNAMLFQA
jgi:hypothetical protein